MKGGALVLAAGLALRFGSDKRRHLVDGRPLLLRTVEQVRLAGLDCRLCLRPGDAGIRALPGLADVECLDCANAVNGMGATLAQGVAACDDWDGLLVVLGDMAWVRASTLNTLFAALAPNRLVLPVAAGKPGNPVGFGRRFFPDLMALDGDRGGREILARHPEALYRVKVDDPGIHRDLDLPAGESG